MMASRVRMRQDGGAQRNRTLLRNKYRRAEIKHTTCTYMDIVFDIQVTKAILQINKAGFVNSYIATDLRAQQAQESAPQIRAYAYTQGQLCSHIKGLFDLIH